MQVIKRFATETLESIESLRQKQRIKKKKKMRILKHMLIEIKIAIILINKFFNLIEFSEGIRFLLQ